MTEDLARGYWPSYNVAFFPDMYEAAGYPDMIARLEAAGEAKHSFAIHWLKYQVHPAPRPPPPPRPSAHARVPCMPCMRRMHSFLRCAGARVQAPQRTCAGCRQG